MKSILVLLCILASSSVMATERTQIITGVELAVKVINAGKELANSSEVKFKLQGKSPRGNDCYVKMQKMSDKIVVEILGLGDKKLGRIEIPSSMQGIEGNQDTYLLPTDESLTLENLYDTEGNLNGISWTIKNYTDRANCITEKL